jgi:hypothetical protein
MRKSKTDPLGPAIESLERVLRVDSDAKESTWLDEVKRSLANVEKAFNEHTRMAEATDGLLQAMNTQTRSIRPTLDRRVDALHGDHEQLLEQIQEVEGAVQERLEDQKKKWRRIWRGFGRTPGPQHIRQETERLLDSLREHKESETKLLLDTINTDIGTGD